MTDRKSADLSIRFARPDDVPLIRQLIRELADYEKAPEQAIATEDELRTTLFGSGRRAEALLAFEGTESVGYAVFFHNYSTWLGRAGLYLEDLYVRPHARGRGHGRRLLAHLASIAVDRECLRMEWSVLDWNSPAIGFYRSLGAVAMDEWTVYRLKGDPLASLAAEARVGEAP